MIKIILTKLKKIYLKEQFNPSILGLFINPYYFSRISLYKAIKSASGNLDGSLLDIGCGNKPYEQLFNVESYIGVELDTVENRTNKKADYFYDGLTLPFSSDSFDSIICNQVFEHVFNPDQFLQEIFRVTKPGGKIILTAPFIWDEHEQPYDFARYTSYGLNFLLKKYGFEVITFKKTLSDASLFFQLINVYLYKVTLTKNKYFNLSFMVFLHSFFNVIGLFLSFLLPKNKDLYLDNVVLAKKL